MIGGRTSVMTSWQRSCKSLVLLTVWEPHITPKPVAKWKSQIELTKLQSDVLHISCFMKKLVIFPLSWSTRPTGPSKNVNFDLKTVGDHRKVQINELNELRDQAYENFLIYKEKTNRLHDSKIKDRVFNIVDRVLLFNSHLKIFSGKLKSCWSGPFTISQVYPYGAVELSQPDGPNFKVNGHRLKHYFGENVPKLVVPDLQTFPRDH
uniref:Reverse transcriptase domain-containing protein n=1 Tax=Tanacetum cinerariifolium TaxID=118510 RepID=A0A699KW67_TANCI|nr:reverse transcriptase domain-containing protein [Tanacetum cinerariifolium]